MFLKIKKVFENQKSFRKCISEFCEVSTLLLTVCTVVKSKVEISQNFVTFCEYMNFNASIVGQKRSKNMLT